MVECLDSFANGDQEPALPAERSTGAAALPAPQESIQKLANRYMNQYVMAHSSDGTIVEGIIVETSDQGVTMLVANTKLAESSRQFGRAPGYFRFAPYRFPWPFFRPPFFTPFIFPAFWI
ncbi:MAG: hypothetical protein ABF868_08285 [Sporolactobacillus sp.]